MHTNCFSDLVCCTFQKRKRKQRYDRRFVDDEDDEDESEEDDDELEDELESEGDESESVPGINKSRSNKKQPTVMKSMSGRVIKKPKLGLDAIPFFLYKHH